VSIEKSKESKSIKQFSRFAHTYDSYNIIQAKVAKELVNRLSKSDYRYIIDLGCGSGEVYKNIEKNKINFMQFIAIDSSQEMLKIHPKKKNILKICANFDKPIQENIGFVTPKSTILFSSSALQWSKNLDFTLTQLANNSSNAYFAIFTSNTFKTLHQTAHIDSPIYSGQYLQEVIKRYYKAEFELKEYRLVFKSVREMFHYIKKSGVSGGEKQLSFKEIKTLMNMYPLDYLEFEVLFVEATSLTQR